MVSVGCDGVRRVSQLILAPPEMDYNMAEGANMGAFLLGFICGVGATIFTFVYDEGRMFLNLGAHVRDVTARYKQSRVN